MILSKKILPAFSSMREFERFLESDYEAGIFLELHVSQLKHVAGMAKVHGKKMIYHVDLIQGLKSDEYATEYLCQEFKPYGLISTKANVIQKAKQKGVLSIQRIFLIDSHALEKSYKLIERTKPDFIEVMPGVVPWMITEVKQKLGIEIFAGGLIRTREDVETAIAAGARAITTSDTELWDLFSE
ncbi:glycerol-3-phosphate responsive antiterminator [Bhargavaea cecembensis]|uniref:glycerol-3-phosphate responsive antiterminator n=1 Tax=Bhargavaea cecembensis TaxID=394098 RepID=UPI00058AF206|nr:glycerol-3-phosphate responsive antiterminator [Bhargavaea cecembensis]